MKRKQKEVTKPQCKPRCPTLHLVNTNFSGKPGQSLVEFKFRCQVCGYDHIGRMGEKLIERILTKHKGMDDEDE